jgi:putative phage-type endonuclease
MSLSPEREGRITASIFASAIGIGYDSRQKLWRTMTGREPRFEGNDATQWGHDNEHNAIDAYEIYTGNLVADCGDTQRFYKHPEHDWLGCTPDGFTEARTDCLSYQRMVIEAKSPASMRLYGNVPAHYMPQIQGQMEITNCEFAHFICWTPDGLEVFQVPRSRDYWSMCLELLQDFRQCIIDDVEPKRRSKPVMPVVEYQLLTTGD